MLSPFLSPAGLSDHSEGAPAGSNSSYLRPIRGPDGGLQPLPGREAALDLIEAHLTYAPPFPAGYRPIECDGRLINGWKVPEDWISPPDDGRSFLLKIQPFTQGGYEAVVRQVDMHKIGRAILGENRPHGKRIEPEEPSMDCLAKSHARAKKKVRHLCRNMMATHLLTLTKRELEGSDYWTEEQWALAWDRLRRLLVRVIGPFPYVAILESHKKGNFHLHVAWVGKINVNLVRKMWLSIVGAGGGNIDAKFIRVPHGHDRSNRIAGYISKYVSKSFEQNPRFNKKRYWSSKQSMEECRRYVLRALTLDDAMGEVKRLLGLDYGKFLVWKNNEAKTQNLFMFPDGGGAWINYIPGVHDPDLPF